jgi:hypothetical protein
MSYTCEIEVRGRLRKARLIEQRGADCGVARLREILIKDCAVRHLARPVPRVLRRGERVVGDAAAQIESPTSRVRQNYRRSETLSHRIGNTPRFGTAASSWSRLFSESAPRKSRNSCSFGTICSTSHSHCRDAAKYKQVPGTRRPSRH